MSETELFHESELGEAMNVEILTSEAFTNDVACNFSIFAASLNHHINSG